MTQRYKFKLRRGVHSEKNADGKDVTYYPGDVIDSASDLSKHNQPGCLRYEKLDVVEPIGDVIGPANDDLGTMTISQLRAQAEEHRIDLGEATLKADIVETIRSELNAVEA